MMNVATIGYISSSSGASSSGASGDGDAGFVEELDKLGALPDALREPSRNGSSTDNKARIDVGDSGGQPSKAVEEAGVADSDAELADGVDVTWPLVAGPAVVGAVDQGPAASATDGETIDSHRVVLPESATTTSRPGGPSDINPSTTEPMTRSEAGGASTPTGEEPTARGVGGVLGLGSDNALGSATGLGSDNGFGPENGPGSATGLGSNNGPGSDNSLGSGAAAALNSDVGQSTGRSQPSPVDAPVQTVSSDEVLIAPQSSSQGHDTGAGEPGSSVKPQDVPETAVAQTPKQAPADDGSAQNPSDAPESQAIPDDGQSEGDVPGSDPVDQPTAARPVAAAVSGTANEAGSMQNVGSQTSVPVVPSSPAPVVTTPAMVSAARVLDMLEVMSLQPPPRTLTLDLTDLHGVRVTLALDGGAVNVSVSDSGAGNESAREWARQLDQLLSERDFGSDARSSKRSGKDEEDDSERSSLTPGVVPTTKAQSTELRL